MDETDGYVFGYTHGDAAQEAPHRLREVTFCLSPAQLREVAAFLCAQADALQAQPEAYDHAHFVGRAGGPRMACDVVVLNPVYGGAADS